jgi:hypothetical protein
MSLEDERVTNLTFSIHVATFNHSLDRRIFFFLIIDASQHIKVYVKSVLTIKLVSQLLDFTNQK